MKLLSPTPHKRLNEIAGFLLLAAGLVMLLSLISYHAFDPSLDTASAAAERLYARQGWQLCGQIPDYALRPNGTPCATAILFKSLRARRSSSP